MTSQVDVTATRGLSECLTALFRSLFLLPLCGEGRRGAGEGRKGVGTERGGRERGEETGE